MGIVLCVADMILAKSGKQDIAFWIGIAGVVIIMAMVVPQLGQLFNRVKSIFSF
jgi:stage III sporulation protein AC